MSPTEAAESGATPGATTPEQRKAYELLSQESGLWGEILYELLGEPRRYSELTPLLGEQAENTLTYALKKLVDGGLVKRTSDVVDDELVKRYRISRQGIDVFLHMQVLETLDRFAEAARPPVVDEIDVSDEVAAAEADRLDVGSVVRVGSSDARITVGSKGEGVGASLGIAGSEGEGGTLLTAEPSEDIRSGAVSYISLTSQGEGSQGSGNVYHVRPVDDGSWSVKRKGAQRATKRFDQPRLAVARALELAGENGKVFVHGADDQVRAVFDAPARARAEK